MLRLSLSRMAFVNVAAIIGAFATVSSGYWDITRHSLLEVDTFFTTAHLLLYLGIGLVALASFLGATWLRRCDYVQQPNFQALLSWSKIAVVGVVIQLFAGPFDFWWHSTFGFDPVLLSPPHAVLIIGIAITSYTTLLSAVRLRQIGQKGLAKGLAFSSKLTTPLLVVAATTLWMQLNLVLYLFSIDSFVRISVGEFTSPAALILLVVPGTLLLATVTQVTERFGYATITAAVFLTTTILTNFIPRGIFLFIPIVLATLVPVAVFDRLLSAGGKSKRIGWRVLLVGPPTLLLYFPWTWALIHFPGANQIIGSSLQSTASDILTGMLQMSLVFLVPWIIVAFFAANKLVDRLVRSLSISQLAQKL